MECFCEIKLAEYVFYWKSSFNKNMTTTNMFQSNDFYTGIQRKNVWRMELDFNDKSKRDAKFASLRLLLVEGPTTKASVCFKCENNGITFDYTMGKTEHDFGKEKFHTCNTILRASLKNAKEVIIRCELKICEETLPYLHNWDDDLKIFSRDIYSLLTKEKHADVSLISQDGIEYRAHRAVLSARSDVFAAMFDNNMIENLERKVEISDMEACDLLEMLNYLYSGSASKLVNLETLFVAADKYKIHGLKEICSERLQHDMKVDKCAQVLMLADMHDDSKLKEFCFDFMARNAKEVLISPEWITVSKTYHHLINELIIRMAKVYESTMKT